ncbi:MAG: hypothetical protein HY534_07115 [Chloroflexi bacterium]|nr:hypothetical protein [Chloroflexota bacterium]
MTIPELGGGRRMARDGFRSAMLLLMLAAGVVATGVIGETVGRDRGPEPAVRRYFVALEASDGPGALAEIAPENRSRGEAFVLNGLGNRYRVTGVAVEQASLLERWAGGPSGPRNVTIFLDITQAEGSHWQAAPRVPLKEGDRRWYLGRPPLMPEE